MCPNEKVEADCGICSLHLCDTGLTRTEQPGESHLAESLAKPSSAQVSSKCNLHLDERFFHVGQPEEIADAPRPPTGSPNPPFLLRTHLAVRLGVISPESPAGFGDYARGCDSGRLLKYIRDHDRIKIDPD